MNKITPFPITKTIGEIDIKNINEKRIIPFKNSDASKVADLFNENLVTHYRPSLQKEKEEFFDKLFQGFNADSDFKYIIEDEQGKSIKAFLEIKTADNENYFVDIIVSNGNFEIYSEILSYAVKKVIKRNKKLILMLE